MAVDNRSISSKIDRSKSSDDAHLLIGRAMGEVFRRENITESSVSCPPAFLITDSNGNVYTLGFDYVEHGTKYEFMVLCNDKPTGQFAEKIEYTRNANGVGGVVRLYGRDGTRVLSRNKSCFI